MVTGHGDSANVDQNIKSRGDDLNSISSKQKHWYTVNIAIVTSLCGSDLLHLAIKDASWVTGEPEGKTSVILTQHSRDSLVDRSRVLTARMSCATSRMEMM